MKCFWTQKKPAFNRRGGGLLLALWPYLGNGTAGNCEKRWRTNTKSRFALLPVACQSFIVRPQHQLSHQSFTLAVEVLQVYGESSSSLSLLICTSQPPSLCYRLTEGPQGPYISSTHTHLLSPSEPIKRLLREWITVSTSFKDT